MNTKKHVKEESEGRVYDSNIEGRKLPDAVIRTEPHTKLSKPATKDSSFEKRKLPEDILRKG